MIAIIDGCGTNINSIIFALKRLGCNPLLTTDKNKIKQASHVLLPGVGSATHALTTLTRHDLVNFIPSLTQPVLGICLGMQLLYEFTEEGDVDGLGVFTGKVIHIPQQAGLTIPHMGWNQLQLLHDSPLLKNIKLNSYVYFVHSFCAEITQQTQISVNYGIDFCAVVSKDNFHAVQFHPERSGQVGAQILQNFFNIE